MDKKCTSIFGKSLLLFVMKYAKNPFPEQRIGGFHLINGRSKHAWGLKLCTVVPKFMSWIQDRDTEQFKELKEWKFIIIDSIVSLCKTHHDIIDIKEEG
jgi:hypothetical protein